MAQIVRAGVEPSALPACLPACLPAHFAPRTHRVLTGTKPALQFTLRGGVGTESVSLDYYGRYINLDVIDISVDASVTKDIGWVKILS